MKKFTEGSKFLMAMCLAACGGTAETSRIEHSPVFPDATSQVEQASVCGPTDDAQFVNDYNGQLGPTAAFVDANKGTKGFLVHPINNTQGAVCSGALVGSNLFLTAGHCIKPTPGFQPYVTMNYEQAKGSTALLPMTKYNVTATLEKVYVENSGIDYAILQLEGTPGDTWGAAAISKDDAAIGSQVTLISHPLGAPKKIEAGTVSARDADYFAYADLDTLGGSSGGSIIDTQGKIVGVHHGGNCTPTDGANMASRISRIRAQSAIVGTDCLLNWAEANYPSLFSPAGTKNTVGSGYIYRYYSGTNAYVGVSLSDGHVYYMGPDGKISDQGALTTWRATSGCQ